MAAQGSVCRALGLMSGTSMDGVDVALIETDGAAVLRFGPAEVFPYDDADRDVLRRALADALPMTERTDRPGALRDAEALITRRHVEAVLGFCTRHGIQPAEVDVVGFHGQTVLHRPEARLTVQIGDGAALARHTGIDVVADLRAADVAAGGQGAPLVPVYHQALVAAAKLAGPVLVINIGGVANVTYVDGTDAPIACDTGPGNALLDDLMLARTGVAVDRDGATAAVGTVDPTALASLMNHPFFAEAPPKSLDRNGFSSAPVAALPTPDAAATLTAFTAVSIAAVLPHLPARPARAIACGGGARNPTLMAALAERLGCPVTTAEAQGWNGDAVEAQAFAYLAVRSLHGQPLTFPTTTGVAAPTRGGVTFRGRPRRSGAATAA